MRTRVSFALRRIEPKLDSLRPHGPENLAGDRRSRSVAHLLQEVRFWHNADPTRAASVRFRWNSGHRSNAAKCPLLTYSES